MQKRNVFRDKYRFLLHGETETDFRSIWIKMERAAHETCPSTATTLN